MTFCLKKIKSIRYIWHTVTTDTKNYHIAARTTWTTVLVEWKTWYVLPVCNSVGIQSHWRLVLGTDCRSVFRFHTTRQLPTQLLRTVNAEGDWCVECLVAQDTKRSSANRSYIIKAEQEILTDSVSFACCWRKQGKCTHQRKTGTRTRKNSTFRRNLKQNEFRAL